MKPDILKSTAKGLLKRMGVARFDPRDCRSRLILFVPHCVLNQNARAAGAAERPASVTELVSGLIDRDIGIVQMPCPELLLLGLDRGDSRIREDLSSEPSRGKLIKMAGDIIYQIRQYQKSGIQVLGILGKNGSPTCGVEQTWHEGVVPGSGIFIEVLREEMNRRQIHLGITGCRDNEPEAALAAVDRWMQEAESGK